MNKIYLKSDTYSICSNVPKKVDLYPLNRNDKTFLPLKKRREYLVQSQGLSSTIRSEEIEKIKLMIDRNKNISLGNQYLTGDCAKTIFGPLTGDTDIFIQQKVKCRFGIKLDLIAQTDSIEINKEDIIQLDN